MRRLTWLALVMAVCCLQVLPAHAQAKKDGRSASKVSDAPKPADIDHNGVLILVRSTLLALDHANRTGNYSVLRELGAPDFQANNPARLGEIFAKQRNEGLDLSGVAVLEPQLTLMPQIESNGMLHMAGFFPSAAMQLNFELVFAPIDRQWKISAMLVKVGTSAPKAPDSPPIPAPLPPVQKPEPPAAAITTKSQIKKPGRAPPL
ncbi:MULTISPECIES: hypothetical protein [unclassified Mesorhizobium]|uniref:hypothetical protein n=1 Tax=unclassified Mesorhizobium TaxID=325217 RepID=UPI00067F23E0|nr:MULTISPECIES: hypothetical protein [unclassified Mesorhizobium]WJI61360.1 hypothetical protein NLY43_22420 [Mesorhizobium sp. C416B]